MFTEQPAPPPPVAEVQVQPADATATQAPAPAPAAARVATPETMVTPVVETAPPTSAPATPEPTSPSHAAPAPPVLAPTAAPSTSTPTSAETAKAQRKQEIEQKLLELTSKARAKRQEQQQQQAEAETAKYGESGDLEEAERVLNNPALPANVRAALLKRLQAKQAQKGRKPSTAKSAKPGAKTTASASGRPPGFAGGMSPSLAGRDYVAAPIVPLSQAQMRLRLGQLIGRNLNFAFPLSIPAPITSLFGWRIHPISGSPRFHRGIDFGAPMGTPIVAAKAGRVDTANTMDGYGLTVIVQHGMSQQTLYAHMSQIFVQPGEVVKKGQLLGLVGSTGNSTGPHLHFEIHEMTSEGWMALDPAIAMNGAIALAQNPEALQTTSRKPQSFNLALSGLLDINLPTQTLPGLTFGNTLLSGLSLPPTQPQDEITPQGLQLSLALLPSAIPELGWLISPLVDDLAAELSIPLPGLFDLAQTVSFQPIPALRELPEPVAFQPNSILPTAANAQITTTRPLAGLTIAEQVPGAVRFPALQAAQPGPIQSAPTTRDRAGQSNADAQRLRLSTRRIKPLDGG